MNFLQITFVEFCAAILLSGSPLANELQWNARPPKSTVASLMREIKNRLPEGWSVSVGSDNAGAVMEIRRDHLTLATSEAPNLSVNEKPESVQVTYALGFVSFISPPEYQRLKAENQKIEKQVDAVYVKLEESSTVSRKFDDFDGGNEEDKRNIAEYRRLENELHALPRFHYQNVSLEWAQINIEFGIGGWLPTNEATRRECDDVLKKIESVVSTY
jgi:hypothetical protein